MQLKPDIRPGLFWEYDLETFKWEHSYKIVIERVVQREWIDEWRQIYKFYGPKRFLRLLSGLNN